MIIKKLILMGTLATMLSSPAFSMDIGLGASSYGGAVTPMLYSSFSAGFLSTLLPMIPSIQFGVMPGTQHQDEKYGIGLFVRDLQPIFKLGPAEIDVTLGLLAQNHTPANGPGEYQKAPLIGGGVQLGPAMLLLERDVKNALTLISVGVGF